MMVYVMRNGRRVIVALSFLLLCCGVHVHAQRPDLEIDRVVTDAAWLLSLLSLSDCPDIP